MLPRAKKPISEALMIRLLRRPIWSAISPEAATAPAHTMAPENCTIRNSPGERPVLLSASHAIGKIVTRWNSAKAASGTKAPRITSPAWWRNSSRAGTGRSRSRSIIRANSSVATRRSRANSATTLMVKAQ